jgi:hypothetical protein
VTGFCFEKIQVKVDYPQITQITQIIFALAFKFCDGIRLGQTAILEIKKSLLLCNLRNLRIEMLY